MSDKKMIEQLLADSKLAFLNQENELAFNLANKAIKLQNNKLTWHELNDLTTIQMVPTKVNSKFTHLGGISEAKLK